MSATNVAFFLPFAACSQPRQRGAAPGRSSHRAAGALSAVVLGTSLVLSGCGSTQANALPGGTPTATATASPTVQVVVPDVVGMRADAAAKALKEAGLTSIPTLSDVKGQESVAVPSAWEVTSQDPAAGSVVPADNSISLSVGRNEAEVKATEEALAQSSRQAADLANARMARAWKAAQNGAAAE